MTGIMVCDDSVKSRRGWIRYPQRADIGRDETAVETSRHAAVAFKLPGFGVTLFRHWFSFQNLVNSLLKSILPDSENRCGLPVARFPD